LSKPVDEHAGKERKSDARKAAKEVQWRIANFEDTKVDGGDTERG